MSAYQDLIDEVRRVRESHSRRYFRIQLDRSMMLHICELSYYDEFDYDESLWFTDEKFDTRLDAIQWLISKGLFR